jgi:cellulose 1,4-beta-cellobiosidase
VGSRIYLLESDDRYKLFKLGNRELAFDVDVSTLQCGMNGAIYLVEMEADGGTARYPTNKAGAKYGTGYCDAQCPSTTFVSGEANSQSWGNYGACCAEFDLWEANKEAHVWTGHPCRTPGYYRCQGSECGNGG